MPDLHGPQQRHNCQHRSDSSAVVGNTWTVKARPLLPYVQRRACGKNCVEVGAQGNVSRSHTGMNSEDVADVITVNVVKSLLAEPGLKPIPACGFTEGGSRNARRLKLPTGKLRFVGSEPGEGVADFLKSLQPDQVLLEIA